MMVHEHNHIMSFVRQVKFPSSHFNIYLSNTSPSHLHLLQIYICSKFSPSPHIHLISTSSLNILYLYRLCFSILPSTLQSFQMLSIITNNLSLLQENSLQCNKHAQYFPQHLHHIALIYHLYTYQTSPCHPRVLLICPQLQSQSHFPLASEFFHIPFQSKPFLS